MKIDTVLPGQGGSGYQGNWGPGNDGPLDRTYQIGGLGADARQISRVSGPGYQHESSITRSPGSRAQTRSITTGSLSTSGPTPTGGPPQDPQKIGPSGPRKSAAGVKGNFTAGPPHLYAAPKWGEVTGKTLKGVWDTGVAGGRLTTAIGLSALDQFMGADPTGAIANHPIVTKVFGNLFKHRIPTNDDEETEPGMSPGGIILPKPGYTPKGNP